MPRLGRLDEPVAVATKGQAPSVRVFAGEPGTARLVRERLRTWSDGGVVFSMTREDEDVLLEVGDGSRAERHRANLARPRAKE